MCNAIFSASTVEMRFTLHEIRSTKEFVRKNKLFLQNEPNFRKSQMNLTDLLTMNYVQMDTWSIRKNEPNTNPNEPKTNPILANKTTIRTQFKPKQTQFQRQKPSGAANDKIRQLPIPHDNLSDICRLTAEMIDSTMAAITFERVHYGF